MIPEAHRTMPYCSCTLTNGIKYIFSSHDRIIGESMLRTGINFAENQIKAFFELTDKYYGKKARNGYFFDVGANIGTTSIYVKKELNPKLKIIGIEAGKDNYDLFRMNCIANNVEDIKVCHVAFADAAGKAFFNENTDNPGGSSVTKTNNIAGKNCETVNMITFDEFCEKETINSGQIDYIWIDVEGFEVNVLKGAATVLKNKIPMMQEFNPFVYEEKGLLNEYLSIIEGTYNYYLDYSEYIKGKELKRPVSEIRELIKKCARKKECRQTCSL